MMVPPLLVLASFPLLHCLLQMINELIERGRLARLARMDTINHRLNSAGPDTEPIKARRRDRDGSFLKRRCSTYVLWMIAQQSAQLPQAAVQSRVLQSRVPKPALARMKGFGQASWTV